MASSSSSINELPFELLADIFDLSVERGRFTAERHYFQCRFQRQAAPLNLIGVCRLWRFLALGTPKLWDSFSFQVSQKQSLLKGWLDQVPDAPFRLRTPSCHPSKQAETARICSHFRLLSEVCHRWKSLRINLVQSMAEEFISFLKRVDFASLSLTDLEMTFNWLDPASFEETLSSIVSYLPSMPTIQHLTLEVNRACKIKLQDLDLPWSQYKTIKILYPNMSIEEIALCLSRCTSATTIHFNYRGVERHLPPVLPYDPPFTLDALTTLSLSKSVDPLNLLPYFTLPSLKKLIIDVHERNHGALESFLSRTPSLHTLIVGESLQPSYKFVGATDQDLVDWLCSAYLRPLPCFQLYIQRSHMPIDRTETLGRKLIERFSKTGVVFPPLVCFTGDVVAGRTSEHAFEFIGWRDRLQEGRQVFWTYREGVFL